MTIAAALILVAIGAILKFAITAEISGVDITMIGLILMIIGAIGFVLALLLRFTRRRTEVVSRVDDGLGPRETRTSYRVPGDVNEPF